MLKLVYCEFDGLPGFQSGLLLPDTKKLNILIGPNGAGKSSILKVLDLGLNLLRDMTLCNLLPKHERWGLFTHAILKFVPVGAHKIGALGEYLGGEIADFLEVHIEVEEKHFFIRKIFIDAVGLNFVDGFHTKNAVLNEESSLKQTQARLSELENSLGTVAEHQTRQKAQIHAQMVPLSASLGEQKQKLAELKLVNVLMSPSGNSIQLDRDQVDSFMESILFPVPVYVPARESPETSIPTLIGNLMALKKGRLPENERFFEVAGRLSRLLQAEVDVSEVDGNESLHIDGVSYQNISSGTETTLAFFGLTHLGDPNCIIIWDEPENGLHPTRRARLLDLISADQRQFFLATHAIELAPVFEEEGKVFRCSSKYDSASSMVRLETEAVATRRDAFELLEALGVHPAKTLFTANVVIWVEGPTELIFYRKWLSPRLSARKIIEGFHYTYMQYGGALIHHLEILNEPEFESMFDLISLCRHPVLIVDSDLASAPNGTSPDAFLKSGARRILNEIKRLNEERSGAAMMVWTEGKEIENYLPLKAIEHAMSTLWSEYEGYKDKIKIGALQLDPYKRYYDSISDHMIAAGITDQDKKDPKNLLAKGRTVWGAANKVNFMRAALHTPDLVEAELLLSCSRMLGQLEEFVVSKSQF